MRFGLKEETIEKINSVLSSFPEVGQAIIYGSRAKGNYEPGSDIDLLLKGDKLDISLLNQISSHLDDLLLPYTFDLSTDRYIDNKELIDHVKRVGKLFYSKNGEKNPIV